MCNRRWWRPTPHRHSVAFTYEDGSISLKWITMIMAQRLGYGSHDMLFPGGGQPFFGKYGCHLFSYNRLVLRSDLLAKLFSCYIVIRIRRIVPWADSYQLYHLDLHKYNITCRHRMSDKDRIDCALRYRLHIKPGNSFMNLYRLRAFLPQKFTMFWSKSLILQ